MRRYGRRRGRSGRRGRQRHVGGHRSTVGAMVSGRGLAGLVRQGVVHAVRRRRRGRRLLGLLMMMMRRVVLAGRRVVLRVLLVLLVVGGVVLGLLEDGGVFACHCSVPHVFVVSVSVVVPVVRHRRVGRLRRRRRIVRRRFVRQDLQGMHHGSREAVGIFSTGEIEAVYVPRIPPLVEGGSRLVVLQTTYYSTVYHHLMIIKLPSDDSEGVVLGVVVDVHLGQAGAGARRHPALQPVVVHHHGGPGAAY